MKEIKMVDLYGQYLKIKKEIDQAIQNVIDSTAFVKGPQVKRFEDELAKYLNVKNVIACANGTDALQIALMALELKPGDEVITSTFTFIATVEVIALLGLTPVLVDVNPDTFLIDTNEIKKAITKRTRAIIPVHLFGQNANMEGIINIAGKHNLYIVEDAAQSIGSDFYFSNGHKQKSGTIGDIGCTSFFPSKNLGCYGDGGAIYTNNEKLAQELRLIANHGMKVQYHYDRIGVNSRLDGIQAAILSEKLKYLDQYYEARQKVAGFYDEQLGKIPGIEIPKRTSNSSHVFHQYTVQVENDQRDKLKDYLQSKSIPSMIYYPIPLHKQKAFQKFGALNLKLPVSEELVKKVLSLPMHTELDEEQLFYITSSIKEYFK
ncbi:MAG: DegT/DnrJ/EryC1/StrS family aminotransferase [Bacteroidales bacterium]|nr:DegT/DnrJ/EryC1/StrS family aminotransferase [Bacteroidales bacterium]